MDIVVWLGIPGLGKYEASFRENVKGKRHLDNDGRVSASR
jgi:hypothetical protein